MGMRQEGEGQRCYELQHRAACMASNAETSWAARYNEANVASFEVLSQYSPRYTEERHGALNQR
jgi:hypothetical protein